MHFRNILSNFEEVGNRLMSSNINVQFVKSNSDESFVLVEETQCEKPCEINLSNSLESDFDFSLEDDSNPLCSPMYKSLTADELQSFCDVDGRLIHESKLRESMFYGGCEEKIRRVVWSYIFHLYPMNSTAREQYNMDIENHYKYHALKLRWQIYMNNYNGVDVNGECPWKPCKSDHDNFMVSDLPPYEKDIVVFLTDEHNAQKNLARTYASRMTLDDTPGAWLHVVEKDIPRTDIDHPYFSQDSETQQQKMRNILITFGFFHPTIGYVQGMNDILTRFLVVMDSEVDAYWCFSNYMEEVEKDFDEHGMIDKLTLVQKLLIDMEPNLYSHLDQCGVGDLMFCHRWLLVSFKREFSYSDSIRYFEMAHSKHLELDSLAALSIQDEQYRTEVMKDKGKNRPITSDIGKPTYTFEVFVCVAIIMLKRQKFLASKDEADVFSVACNIRGTIQLRDVHAKACELFVRYCKKSISDKYCKSAETDFWGNVTKFVKKIMPKNRIVNPTKSC